jgi:hypothetical protein
MPIRRNVVHHTYEPASHIDLATTPGGRNVYGSTPGGTKIVYSREQLLSLASSPLSAQQHFDVPNEISKSPTNKQHKDASPPRRAALHPVPAPLSHSNGFVANSTSRNAFSRSAPRSPGNAFDFSKGPVVKGASNSPKKRAETGAAVLTNGPKYFKHPDEHEATFEIEL